MDGEGGWRTWGESHGDGRCGRAWVPVASGVGGGGRRKERGRGRRAMAMRVCACLHAYGRRGGEEIEKG